MNDWLRGSSHDPALAFGGVVVGGTIPYKPDMLKKKQENFQHSLARDPEVKCLVPGIPRFTMSAIV